MTLTRQQRAQHIANTELATIDRDLQLLNEDRARHRHCGPGCERWTNDTAMIDGLLTHRIRVSDWNTTETMDNGSQARMPDPQVPDAGRR